MWRLMAIPLILFSNLVSAAEKCDASFHAISIAKPRYTAPISAPELNSVSVLFEFIITPDGELSKIKVLQSYSRPKNGFTRTYEHRARQALVASRFTKVEEACMGQYRFTYNLPE